MAEDDELDLNALAEMAEAASLIDAASIKDALPIAYVLEQAGIAVTETGSGLSFFCPFHEDRATPAGSVFGEGLGKWSCWAGCTEQPGDVVDLVSRLAELDGETLNFVQACDRASGHIATLVQSGWSGPKDGKKRTEISLDTVSYLVGRAQENDDRSLIDELLADKRRRDGQDSNRFSTDWLVNNFRLGVAPVRTKAGWRDELVMPYYDINGRLATYKHRSTDTKAFAPAGAWPKDLYYNSWRTDRLDSPLLLCEGESDTWNAQYEVGDTYRVLGLATGVATRPGSVDIFKNRTVLIAFDGDGDAAAGTKGRGGSARWASFLSQVEGCEVKIVPMPDGKDVSSVAGSLRRLCEMARPIIQKPNGLRETTTGYARPGQDGDTAVSNFVFKPVRELLGSDHSAWEGILLPGGDKVVISDNDLRNKPMITTWAIRNRKAWFGTDRDVTILLGQLQAASTYLPIGHMASTAGLHSNHFVWPGDSIGPEPWTYVPPANSAQLEEAMFIRRGTWEPTYVHTLRDMHKATVIDPMLAWMAAAPLRSHLKEFPILAISGPHGSGKTRTLETLLRSFTGTYIANTLTGTTPHAVISGFAATNAFPVVFEEYRNGARESAKERFEQLARDAYTMQKSQIGGMKGSWAELTSIVPCAPIVVSGEDMFTEGSHVERMILIQMYRDGQNPKAFTEANSWKNNGLPYAYLTWLHRSLMDGSIAELTIKPDGPSDLGPRQRLNLGILNFGWELLRRFLADAGETISDPDFTATESELREANAHTPIEDAIFYCLAEQETSGFCKIKDGNVMIRMEAFVGYINEKNRRGDLGLTLPGRGPSVKKYLQAKFSATDSTEKVNGLLQTFTTFEYRKIAR